MSTNVDDSCRDKMRPYTPVEISAEERDRLRGIVFRQCREIGVDAMVTCQCGHALPLIHVFRCFYCGVWLCRACAKDHFSPDND